MPPSSLLLRRASIAPALFALLLLAAAGPARAEDEVSGTKNVDKVAEARHEIALKVDRGHAVLVVQRTFRNSGPKHDQAMVHILDLPLGAVATGLRTQGTKDGKPIWYSGELMDAEAAAAKYKELTGIGGYFPKDPALLSWRDASHLALQVFPIEPGGTKTIEYTLEVPTRWVGGRDVLELPRMGVAKRPAQISFAAAHTGDVVWVDDGKPSAGALVPLSDSVSVKLERAAEASPTLGGRYASVSFAKNRTLLHTAVELAPRLSQIPKDAHVIVVLDGSRSLTELQRKAERAAADAYLAHFGDDARVEVLTFARKVKALHESFVGSKQARADLAKLTLPGENGSAIDDALAEALRRLGTAPAKAPRRIVVVTDLRTRAALTPKALTTVAAGASAVVHLATIDGGEPSIERDDDDRWAAVPRATGGVLWRARATSDIKAAGAMSSTYEEWARPVRIDRLSVTGVGLPGSGLGLPSSLAEGQGFDDLRIESYAPPALSIGGELWSTSVKTLLSPSEDENRLWSALVFGSALQPELKEPEMTTLAFRGRAVSPMTSYLAIEPGVRPSTEGLEQGTIGWGDGIGLGRVSGFGKGGGLASVNTFDRLLFLRTALEKHLASCGAAGRTATLTVETTLTELVHARVTALSGLKNEAIGACLEDAAYALELPANFHHEWATYEVKLGVK